MMYAVKTITKDDYKGEKYGAITSYHVLTETDELVCIASKKEWADRIVSALINQDIDNRSYE